ncbi:MAG TPA: hypothetical protein VF765_37155 [Polyangiaceae bacterium]
MRKLVSATALLALVTACKSQTNSQPEPHPESTIPGPSRASLTRADFNRAAVRLDLPLFWRADANGNGHADPEEIATLLFYPTSDAPDLQKGRETILGYFPTTPQGATLDDARRRALVAEDLDQGAPTLIETDLRNASPTDKKLFEHMLAAAKSIDEIYATMVGAKALAARVAADDTLSQSLFRRNWGPQCVCAKTRDDAQCNAIAGAPKRVPDAYPTVHTVPDQAYCKSIAAQPNAKDLMAPFTVIDKNPAGGTPPLVAVPYTERYREPMQAVSKELAAAAADETDPGEAALKAYLDAAAKSFATNDWGPADEAWSRMNPQNSKWYVRVAPDEVLTDPCNFKAQFHLTLARIDQGSLGWQAKLTPVEQDMEGQLASLVGAAYTARHVSFHLPDFIDIVLNAGDDRAPVGATAGESLPNWGKVEEEGRGRTVAMVNIGATPDTLAMYRKQLESLLDAESMKTWADDPQAQLMTTILHEATHNLGPTYTYVYKGTKPAEAFGGKLSAMLEELKAETGGIYWLDWLRGRSIVTPELQKQAYAAWMAWALRHISVGVHSGTGDEPYAQLAAVQLGFAMDDGAVTFDPAASAANGTDKGAFTIHYDKLPATLEKLMKRITTIKATNDKAAAEALVAQYVDGPTVPQKTIADRELRFPQLNYVYAVER